MQPLATLQHAVPDEELATVMERMVQEDINQVPVLDDGRFVGMISRNGLLAYLAERGDLEPLNAGKHSLPGRLTTVPAPQMPR